MHRIVEEWQVLSGGDQMKTLRIIRPLSFITLVSCTMMATAAPSKAETDVTFGVVPQQSASRLAKVWVPLLAHLSQEAGVNFRFVTAKNIPAFERCLAGQAYDVAYMNPLHYVHFHDLSGYEAIARRKGKKLKGILVVRNDSKIDNLKDLDGSELAFPSPAAFGASVLPRAELSRQKIAFKPKYVSSHDSVYRAVAAGIIEAGGGVFRTFNTVRPDVRSQLRVFYTTDGYTPHAIAHRKGLPQELVDRIRAALVNLKDKSPARLKKLGIRAFETANNSDWDDVRALNISSADFDVRTSNDQKCR